MKIRYHLFAMFLITLVLTLPYFAQSSNAEPDDEDVQSWNDFQLDIPLSKQFTFYSKVTMRFGANISRLNEGRHTFGVSWKPVSSLTISPFYTYIRARNSAGRFRKEDRYSLSAAYKLPIKPVGVTHKSTYEKRHRASGDSWRYKAQLTIEKALPESFIKDAKWFVSDEVFYDSATSKFSRNRFSVGIHKNFSKHFGVELYYLRQNDGYSHPGDLNVVGFNGRYRL